LDAPHTPTLPREQARRSCDHAGPAEARQHRPRATESIGRPCSRRPSLSGGRYRTQFRDSCLTAIKSGAAFEALGNTEGAEAAYRRALILAEDESEGDEAFSQLAGLLEDMGRFEELEELLSPSMEHEFIDTKPFIDAKPLAPVGRNDPCPCGSGKKSKKCHGA